MVTTHSACWAHPLSCQWCQRTTSSYAVILELRLYAMYGRTRKILALLSFLILCEACAMGIIFGTPKAGVIGDYIVLVVYISSLRFNI